MKNLYLKENKKMSKKARNECLQPPAVKDACYSNPNQYLEKRKNQYWIIPQKIFLLKMFLNLVCFLNVS